MNSDQISNWIETAGNALFALLAPSWAEGLRDLDVRRKSIEAFIGDLSTEEWALIVTTAEKRGMINPIHDAFTTEMDKFRFAAGKGREALFALVAEDSESLWRPGL